MIGSIINGFDVWTDAQGVKSKGRVKSLDNISLEGLARLRELILELAIQGKLVSQNQNDTPSIELLKVIKKVNLDLIKEGKLRKIKELPAVEEAEFPFSLPSGWQFVRLNEIGEWGSGSTPNRSNPEYYGGGIPWFKSGELISDFIDTSEEFITEKALKETSVRYNNVGDVLIAMYGATIGKTSILKVKATTNQAVCACTPFYGIENTFLLTLLKAYKNRFIGMGAGGAQPNISRDKIINTVIGLPPTEEQKRIVEKVKELMALCDKLEEEQIKKLSTHKNLVKSLLETLTLAKDADELKNAWAKLSEHFDTLFCTEDSIEQLRQALLELVIAGRFKTQNDTDTPASVTFEKIKEELAEKHGKEYLNKLKRDMSTIEPRNFHFTIPESWIWCELQDLAILFNGKAHEQFVDENGDYVLVNSSFVSSEGKVAKFVSSQLTPLIKGNIAIVMSDVPGGKALVKCYLVEENDKYSLNQRIGGIDASSHIDIRYLFLVLNRNKYYLQYDDGKKQTNLKKIQILSCPVPLPPIEEQERIVNKWNELLEICNRLIARINTANEINVALSNSIMTVV